MSGAMTYTGGCHCGEVRFEVTTDLGNVTACNCSICQKRGALWSFVPPASFALRAGADALKDYQFGKKSIHHLFCPHCGVGAFSVTNVAEHAPATRRQRFCRKVFAFSKGLAMLIRSATNGSIDSEASARAIAAACLPARLAALSPSLGLIGLLLLSCP